MGFDTNVLCDFSTVTQFSLTTYHSEFFSIVVVCQMQGFESISDSMIWPLWDGILDCFVITRFKVLLKN